MTAFTPGNPIETTDPTVIVDGLAPGVHTFRLVVMDDSGNASLPSEAKVTVADPAPKLTGFAPAFGLPGDAVALAGINLEDSADKVAFGTVAAAITTMAPTRIDTVVPAGAVTAPIRVDNPHGSSVTGKAFVVPRFTVTRKLPAPSDADHDPIAKELWVSGNGPAGAAAPASVVFALSLPDGKLSATVSVSAPTGDIAVSRSAQLRLGLVAHPGASSATIFSMDGRKALGVVRFEANPDGVAVSPDGSRGLAALPSLGQVAVIDMQAMRVLGLVKTGRLPSKLKFAQAGKLAFVNCAGDGAIVGINVGGLSVVGSFQAGAAATSNPVGFTDTASGFPVWTANAGNATVSLASSASKVTNAPLGFTPSSIAADAAAQAAFAAGSSDPTLARISAGPKIASGTMPAPSGGYRSLAVTRDGKRVAVAHPKRGAAGFYAGDSLELLALVGNMQAPAHVIVTDDDALFCILDPQGAAVAVLEVASLG